MSRLNYEVRGNGMKIDKARRAWDPPFPKGLKPRRPKAPRKLELTEVKERLLTR
jgi:hypothetical protein